MDNAIEKSRRLALTATVLRSALNDPDFQAPSLSVLLQAQIQQMERTVWSADEVFEADEACIGAMHNVEFEMRWFVDATRLTLSSIASADVELSETTKKWLPQLFDRADSLSADASALQVRLKRLRAVVLTPQWNG